MSIASAVSHPQRTSCSARQRSTHSMRNVTGALLTLGMLLAPVRTAAAQGAPISAPTWEARITSGMFLPTGDQRSHLKDAQVTAAQLSWLVRPSLALTGTFTWARSRDLTSAESPKLDIYSSDVGVEARPAQWFADRAISFSPFAGLGAGTRSYNSRERGVDTRSGFAGYGAVGGEVGIGRVGVRLEVRDYATGTSSRPVAGSAGARNDVVFMAGLRFNRQRVATN